MPLEHAGVLELQAVRDRIFASNSIGRACHFEVSGDRTMAMSKEMFSPQYRLVQLALAETKPVGHFIKLHIAGWRERLSKCAMRLLHGKGVAWVDALLPGFPWVALQAHGRARQGPCLAGKLHSQIRACWRFFVCGLMEVRD